ncbi:unnamed protein product [Clavelina lepadiformis]|uniref:Uncharacterized protein n=1 Tax=Clavelina lepadiformis TaxID=159417 RepID=A0ABP0FSV3_CLALP
MLLGKAMAFGVFCRKLLKKVRNLCWKRSQPPVPSLMAGMHNIRPGKPFHAAHEIFRDFAHSGIFSTIQNGQKRATEVIRQHLEKEESEWEYGLLKQIEEKFRNVYQFDYNMI